VADLTAKQQAFCEAYVSNGFNALQAAISAGYSEKTAKEIGSENLTKPNIAEYVAKFKENATERALVTIEDVVRGLMAEAQGSGEDTSTSARVAAWKALTDYTGGFDQNKIKQENVNIEMSHEEWLESLK
jgi:phage terminase small subunit